MPTGEGPAIPTLRRQQYAGGAQRASDVLQILLAHIGDLDFDVAADLFVGRGRKADAAGLGDSFQARSDVDAVALRLSWQSCPKTVSMASVKERLFPAKKASSGSPTRDIGLADRETIKQPNRTYSYAYTERSIPDAPVPPIGSRALRLEWQQRRARVGASGKSSVFKPKMVSLEQPLT
jgi:hypothetical protein